MTSSHTSSAALVEAAEKLAPLLKAKAREAEIARRPLDEVIDAVRDSGLFSLMVPRVYGGHEADLDAFFDVVVTLSRADASMGWLIGFYIEHNFWFCSYPRSFQEELYADREYVLAPGALNFSAGAATKVEGGYRLSGRWQWGTGIVHGSWVLAGAALQSEDGTPVPFFFALPREQTETIDNWYVSGMCGTGSWDFRIDDVFVPEERGVPVFDLFSNAAEGAKIHGAPLYRTPLAPILGFAAGSPAWAQPRWRSRNIARRRRRRSKRTISGPAACWTMKVSLP